MKVKSIIEKLASKYPQLPESCYWNKYETISFSDRISGFALYIRLNFWWIIIRNNFLLKFNNKETIKNNKRQNGKIKVKNYDNKN